MGLGIALLLAIGLLAVAAACGRPVGRPGASRLVEALALAVVAGPALAAPLLLAGGLVGLPLRGRPTALLLGALAAGLAAAVAVRWRRRPPDGAAPPFAAGRRGGVRAPQAAGASRALLWAGRLTLAAALLLAVVKLALVPLWSWDHFAVWGLKARAFAAAGSAAPAVVGDLGVEYAGLDYPLGVPLTLVAATLGALPDEGVVRGLHVAGLLALVVLVHAAARRLAASPLVPPAAGAFVAASPLAWDSVHLGLADLPLALAAVAAVAAATASDEWEKAGGWALAGLCLGFLPWTKNEGLPLAVLLLAALVGWRWRAGRAGRRADLVALAVPTVLLAGAAVAVRRLLLPRGASFLGGGAGERLAARLGDPAEVLAPVVAELAGWQWLGVWAALLAVLVAAAVRRRPPALLLAAVVAAQLVLYLAVFFVSNIAVVHHVATALHRIAAALVPLAVLAAAALAAPAGHGTRDSRRITP